MAQPYGFIHGTQICMLVPAGLSADTATPCEEAWPEQHICGEVPTVHEMASVQVHKACGTLRQRVSRWK